MDFRSSISKSNENAKSGSALWTDTYPNLELRNAVFLVNLGENASIAQINFSLQKKDLPKNLLLDLTKAERDLIKLISLNKTTKEIATSLNLSSSTIKNYRHKICEKLNPPSGNNSLLSWVLLHHSDLKALE